jgi:hypothetical protein
MDSTTGQHDGKVAEGDRWIVGSIHESCKRGSGSLLAATRRCLRWRIVRHSPRTRPETKGTPRAAASGRQAFSATRSWRVDDSSASADSSTRTCAIGVSSLPRSTSGAYSSQQEVNAEGCSVELVEGGSGTCPSGLPDWWGLDVVPRRALNSARERGSSSVLGSGDRDSSTVKEPNALFSFDQPACAISRTYASLSGAEGVSRCEGSGWSPFPRLLSWAWEPLPAQAQRRVSPGR